MRHPLPARRCAPQPPAHRASPSSGLLWMVAAFAALVSGCAGETTLAARGSLPAQPRLEARTKAWPAPAPLPVIARAFWAEDPPIVSRLRAMGEPWRITLHHEGSDAHELTAIQAVAERLRTTARVHERPPSRGGLGAGDLAYHFVIDRSGRIWEGRSLTWQGAHAGNGVANAGNIGVSLLGNFDLQEPSKAQLHSLRLLLVELCRRYGISPQHVYGHDQVKAQYGLPPTRCPGRYLSAWLRDFRSQPLEPRARR